METVDVALRGVTKTYDTVAAVDNVDLEVHRGEFFSMLGPSGCGKTTSLRLVAGFEHPDSGAVELRGEDVTGVPPYRRDVNTVFQNYELFPHLTVFNNVAYGLEMSGVRKDEIPDRVDEMIEIVRLPGLGSRMPGELSGGQQQRVALARALVNRPAALLLDEPLSALDVQLRLQMQQELRQLQVRLGTTFIYVTHDQEEAMVMSDRIAVMRGGHVLQIGSAREIYEHPASSFVADFIGSLNVLPVGTRAGVRIESPQQSEGEVAARVAIRPERVALVDSTGPPPELGVSFMVGEVGFVEFRGSTWRIDVLGPAGELSSVIVNDGRPLSFKPGHQVRACWPTSSAISMPGTSRNTNPGSTLSASAFSERVVWRQFSARSPMFGILPDSPSTLFGRQVLARWWL